MGATVGVQGEACILGSAYRLHTDTTAFVGTFFINLGEGVRMGMIIQINTQHAHWGTHGGRRVLLLGGYEIVDCKVVRALQSNASIINAIHLTTPSALVLFNSPTTDLSHHCTISTQPSTS